MKKTERLVFSSREMAELVANSSGTVGYSESYSSPIEEVKLNDGTIGYLVETVTYSG